MFRRPLPAFCPHRASSNSDVKHPIPHALMDPQVEAVVRVDSWIPLLIPRGVVESPNVESGTVRRKICVVCSWTDGDGASRSTKEEAKVVSLS